ncbi:MAG: hypothetical protein WB439_11645 [Acidobacteriaceae bacterium]
MLPAISTQLSRDSISVAERTIWLYAKPQDINDATFFYIQIIERAIRDLGLQLIRVDTIQNIPERADVFVIDCKRAVEVRLRRPRSKLWLWLQGIVPEEAELQLGSKIRKWYWTTFERMSIPRAKCVFMVSHAMKDHYGRKYGYRNLPVFIMPCVNQRLDQALFATSQKYSTPRFVYAGSMHRWQCIEEMLDSFALIRGRFPSASLTIYTAEQAAASRMIEARGLAGVDVTYCKPAELPLVLAGYKYGFILRHQHAVNAVATPTKVSSYMAAGVIPILTSAVTDFAERLADVDPIVLLKSADPQEVFAAICRMEARTLTPEMVFASYSKVFREYFDLDRYVSPMSSFLRDSVLAGCNLAETSA